jgi:hypothetical protein
MNAMTINDFERQPRGPYVFDWWVGRQRIATPLGLFSVEFQMLGDEDTNPPDQEMLRRASELVSDTENHGNFILSIVLGHYLLAAEDRGWLESCGVPQGLSRDRIPDYVREGRIGAQHKPFVQTVATGAIGRLPPFLRTCTMYVSVR